VKQIQQYQSVLIVQVLLDFLIEPASH